MPYRKSDTLPPGIRWPQFWLKVFNELKNRGQDDVLIAVVDGLRGFPEAIEAVYPQAQIQTCIVHLIGNSLSLAGWKDRKPPAAALKPIYQAITPDAAAEALQAFAESEWGQKFPTVAAMWQRQWERVSPFFAYPPGSTQSYLHDQRHRKHAHAAAEDRKESRPLPDRRRSQQTALPGLAQYRERLEDADYYVEAGA